ncbi:MAG: PAS domain-containing protein [Proteobacteria bacterium]|nr:PAS domain-containing protein [Pseudomonadota bacterium]
MARRQKKITPEREKKEVGLGPSDFATEVLNLVSDFVVITDCDGKVVYLNPQAMAIAKNSGSPLFSSWKDGGIWKDRLKRVLKTRSQENWEVEIRDRSGTSRVFQVAMVPLKKSQEQVVAVGIVGRDVTELRRQEADLKQKVEQLKACIGGLEELAFAMSHDLRTPVISVQGFANLLVKKYRNRLDDKGIEYLDRLKKEADRLDRLLQDLTSKSRVHKSDR